MKVAIMQPYFFPYIGYFQLIGAVDQWIVFDTSQYISKGWMNRNRVLHPDKEKEWQYITVPAQKHKRSEAINRIVINNNIEWREKILGQLTSYKRKSPYYSEVTDFISEVLAYKDDNLSSFLVNSLEMTCSYLGIEFDYSVFSKMDLDIGSVEHPGEWALRIAAAIGADEYVNPPSGYHLFDESEFTKNNIKLSFLKPTLTPYIQRRGGFVPGLSNIDVLMWNDQTAIREILRDYKIFSQQEIRVMEEAKVERVSSGR